MPTSDSTPNNAASGTTPPAPSQPTPVNSDRPHLLDIGDGRLCDPEYCTGNFELISSDNVVFKVEANDLCSWSPTIISSPVSVTYKVPQLNLLNCVDRDYRICHSETISMVLKICVDGYLDLELPEIAAELPEYLEAFLAAIKFMKRYGFDTALRHVEDATHTTIRIGGSRMVAIIIAANLGSINLICDCLTLPGGVRRFEEGRAPGQKRTDVGTFGHFETHPEHMPLAYTRLCPFWFLNLSTRAFGSVGDRNDLKKVAAIMRKLFPEVFEEDN